MHPEGMLKVRAELRERHDLRLGLPVNIVVATTITIFTALVA